MRLALYDLAIGSADPIDTAAGLPTDNFVSAPRTESIYRGVLDQTSAAVAPAGSLVEMVLTGAGVAAGNPGAAQWSLNKTASQLYFRWAYGIVQAAANSTGQAQAQMGVVVHGVVNALVNPSATTTATPGYNLVSDGLGHLTVAPGAAGATASNLILATALTTISINASTVSALQLVPVFVERG